MKAKVTIAYDGSLFFGSQILREEGDATLPTVLSVFEEALKSIGVFSNVSHAGRTDRFVHSTGQVIGFEIPDFWRDAERLKNELDKKLYPKIHIKKVEIVGDDFHPRFSAKSRVYRYLISTERPPIFSARFITYAPRFDLLRAKEAIAKFVGTHNFYSFSKRGSGEKTTIRTIYSAKIYKHKNLFIARFEGDAFLRSQVRLMTAAILKIAAHKADIKDIDDQFARLHTKFREPAPANGLYLAKIKY
ncbi:MAG: tRNA pseudouridine(38-40) synthase TruA [Helicobacteraceae bacterium]|jgi:tRNA pseudouridine38-40 synthase|nr:tRNA pseudouridine(38-40) synthase TruA [Helicobacteraceae bacterium]